MQSILQIHRTRQISVDASVLSVPSKALRVYSPMISMVSTLSFTAVESECNPQVKLELCKLKNNEQRETESEVYGGR